jgi:hypothetical protein
MIIAILGGTGNIGEGLVLRWAGKHSVIVGSRKAEKAEAMAKQYENMLCEAGRTCDIKGMTNEEAVKRADIVVIGVPYDAMKSLIDGVRAYLNEQIVISLVVPMTKKGKYLMYTPPPQGSAALELREILPESVKLVAAFHNLSAKKLCVLGECLESDVVYCGDDEEAKRLVMELIRDLGDLRPLDGGGLENAYMLEALTPFLINIARLNGLRDLGVKFV